MTYQDLYRLYIALGDARDSQQNALKHNHRESYIRYTQHIIQITHEIKTLQKQLGILEPADDPENW